MFKKFKDKLAEEMKQSPARLHASMQQLAQAVVSPALSNSSIQDLSISNDNFSLTEEGDDTPKNSPAKHGFQNVDLVSPMVNTMGISRRSSITSIASDASSLFPIYESPTNLYHLQSDMDQSASEVDENISPQLDKVTKDQLYSAYRKVKSKYHKYRGRYTDLAIHYRELERVKTKLESVLVETQDKVLRRIADLKEQCQLEQQAKAHLEEALRNDIEEKDHIINTLNTKVKLLQTNGTSMKNPVPEVAEQQNLKLNLIDLSNEPSETNENSALILENAHLKEKLKKLENLVLKYKDSLKRNKEKFTDVLKEKTALEIELETVKSSNNEKLKSLEDELSNARIGISDLTDQVNTLKAREEESVISLAENKLSIHRELEDKEEQIKQLQLDLKHITECKESLNETMLKYKKEWEKLKLLQSNQNLDAESNDIIQDISKGKSEALKVMQQEMEQKMIHLEEKIGLKYHEEVDSNKETVQSLETFEKETIPEKSPKLKENDALKNLQLELREKEIELGDLKTKLHELQEMYTEHRREKEKLETELSDCKLICKELKSEYNAQKIVTEESKKEAEMTIQKLQATIQNLDKELENMRGALVDRDQVCENFNMKIREYSEMIKVAKQKLTTQEAEIKDLKGKLEDNTVTNKLQDELESKNVELLGLESELKSCKSTVQDLRAKVQTDSSKIDLLNKEKTCLITNILYYKNCLQALKEDCKHLKENMREISVDQKDTILNLNNVINDSMVSVEKDNKDLCDKVKTLEYELTEFKEMNIKQTNLEGELASITNIKCVLETELTTCHMQLEEMIAKIKEYDDLVQRNSKLIAEVDNLNLKVQNLEHIETEKEQLSEEIKILQEKLHEQQRVSTVNQDLLEQIDHLQIDLKDAKREIQDLKSKNCDHDVFENKIQNLMSQITHLESKATDTNIEINTLNEKLINKDKEIMKLKNECENYAILIEEHINKINEIQKEHDSSKQMYEEQVAELKNTNLSFQKKLKTNLVQLNKLKTIKEQQTEKMNELTIELNTLKDKNTEISELLQVLEKERETLRNENNEIPILKTNNSSMTSELQQLKLFTEEITLENKDLKDKENELLKCNQELHKSSEILKTKIEEYEQNKRKLVNDIRILNEEVESYKSQLNSQNLDAQNLKSQLVETNIDLQTKNTMLNSENERLKANEMVLKDAKDDLIKQNKELSEKISELNVNLISAESVQQQNKNLLSHIKTLETQLEKLKIVEDENMKVQSELNDIKQENTALKNIQEENNKLIAEHIILTNKIADLENINSTNSCLQSRINELESKIIDLNEVESENMKLKTEIDALKLAQSSENSRLSSELLKFDADNKQLLANVAELKTIIDNKCMEAKSLETKNSDLLEEIERLKASSLEEEEETKKMETLKNTITILEKKVVELNLQIESLNESNSELQRKIESTPNNTALDLSRIQKSDTKEIDKLEEENKKLEAQLDEALITFQAKESQMQIVNDQLRNQTNQLKEELRTKEEEQNMRLKQLVKEFQAQLQDKEEELQAALEKRFDHQQNYESNLIQQYKEQLKDFQIELTAKSEQIENLVLENRKINSEKEREINHLTETIAHTKKEHANGIKELEKKWKAIVQQRSDKLEAKHEEEINELTREWRNERRLDTRIDTTEEELESTSRVAMAAVQSNTGSFHTLQQTLISQKRELAELRRLVNLRHDTLEDSTEIEYLRNILFEYMMGKETMVLARVIAAVVKFDQEQTAKILKKEEDKLSLLGSLGLA